MSTIKAPFNFVPLSDKVYFPDWADKISHDIPFSDGVSGTIELKITAQTPIFVRNGHTKADAEDGGNDTYLSFSKTSDNKYFIPATSIKGAIRSVLEIMSFGKMNRVDNSSFGLREVGTTPTAKSYLKKMRKVQCGWLFLDDDKIKLIECGEPIRISIDEVDKALGTNIKSFITDGENFKKNNGRDAFLKYQKIYCKLKNISMFDKGTHNDDFLKSNEFIVTKTINGHEGAIVLTGQSGVREYRKDKKNPQTGEMGCWIGKGKEFIFKKSIKDSIEISSDLFKAFETIHKNTPDYADFWRIKLKMGHRIPVFFQKNDDGSIHSIGLSYLYKYPYKKDIFSAIPKVLKDPTMDMQENFKPDMAECIFGYTFFDKHLKGRVHFGHACATKGIQDKKIEYVLSSPHASYYPIYAKDGKDWNNIDKISGRKRYILRETSKVTAVTDENKNIKSSGIPLREGAEFTSSIRFHNLKPFELGALLSALTFHGNKKCYHSIGQGKPFGWGRVSIKIEDLLVENQYVSEYNYMKVFEKEMSQTVQLDCTNWLEQKSIQELFALSTPIKKEMNNDFSYMEMEQFRESKEYGWFNSFSNISKNKITLNEASSIDSINENEIATFLNERQAIRKKREEKKIKEIQRQKDREKKEQEKKEEQDNRLKNLDLAFLERVTRFKEGWDGITNGLKKCGRENFDHETFISLPDNVQRQIKTFVDRMFERKDNKWGKNNKDMAKVAANDLVKNVLKI